MTSWQVGGAREDSGFQTGGLLPRPDLQGFQGPSSNTFPVKQGCPQFPLPPQRAKWWDSISSALAAPFQGSAPKSRSVTLRRTGLHPAGGGC